MAPEGSMNCVHTRRIEGARMLPQRRSLLPLEDSIVCNRDMVVPPGEHWYGCTERKDEQECRCVPREEDMHDRQEPECREPEAQENEVGMERIGIMYLVPVKWITKTAMRRTTTRAEVSGKLFAGVLAAAASPAIPTQPVMNPHKTTVDKPKRVGLSM
ncbi:hypothetical protein PAXINDRAFT_21660 [Paxillus involutus ATCC 200175]|uniref:Uncharacterized protein n=1 Tax=Paxillus involutus ATCC 200175 TaxID=664439 RepID=A0A0C9SLV0_PAXIN|nr:hypothetical protein PAXINDRAFT_21660 [Paxillus involutus ATCC 200175]